MTGLGLGLLVSVMVASTQTVAPVSGGNALTLPAQRHVVRVAGRYVLALQQGGQQGRTLGLFRSSDGQSWSYLGSLPGTARTDRADLVAVGNDIALVYSMETPDSAGINGSTEHDVYFQWWRYSASRGTWSPDRPLRVFDSRSNSTAYYRAELARDSRGRLWVQAFKKESNGRSSVAIAVSTDSGNTFREQPLLDSGLPNRGGGRLLALGKKLVVVYDTHGTGFTTRYRVRDDSAPLSSWQSARTAFGESIYHGAALSAVADGSGGMHLVYKDDAERLRYRHFNGSSFGEPRIIESQGDWALQPAITRQGSDLVIFYNRPRGGQRYDLVVRRLRGSTLSSAIVLDGSSTFKGYPNAVETLSSGMSVPVLFGNAPDAASAGQVRVSFAPSSSSRSMSDTDDADSPAAALGGSGTGGSGGGGALAASSGGNAGSVDMMPEMGCGGGTAAMVALPFTLLGLLWMQRAGRREEMARLAPVRVRS
ncbi:hypothetical protein FGE12_26590 [Aggregicoccus sp. 17bor-14]|uniref:hypothetical protein n=1 Tax=Myxococcaceae TaxID=31 RepID=UPI00129CBB00|nr:MULTISPECIES: hypothetical protein [Myxococcaceae]MBF5046009.1 hypothetical protein [Simulacricoccus sp. 17bor-14]MRI91740.1 hypothetical protein [Aggregicoccus sp. 17bor-14]